MSISRRRFLAATIGTSLFATTDRSLLAQLARAAADPGYKVGDGPINHSVMGWCFKPMEALVLAKHCADIGIKGMEGISRDAYKDVRKLGLEISLVGSHGFKEGPCDPKFQNEVEEKLLDGIEVAKAIGAKRVITFTGMKYDGMDYAESVEGCIDTWKKVLPAAEKAGVTICLEHLNSRDDSHPMKGHPGYFGDDVDLCFEMIKAIGSPNFKLLFDVYHVSVMNGDVIRRIRQNHELIGHYHTAGNPGRAELDNTQEINYPPIMRAIAETGFDGFVAHEFIPEWDDPIAALRHGVQVCDIPAIRK